MQSRVRAALMAILSLGILGVIVSLYLLYLHYKPEASAFCTISDFINCDIVNKSKYAEIFGVPVSAIGAAGYSILSVLALLSIKNKLRRGLSALLPVLSGGALLFSFYLTYAELFWLRAICIFCVVSQISILLIFILSIFVWLKRQA